jgi:hypothetical protein
MGTWSKVLPTIAVKGDDINNPATNAKIDLSLYFGRKADPAQVFFKVYKSKKEVFNWFLDRVP